MNSNEYAEKQLVLSSNLCVPEWLFESIKKQVIEIAPAVDPYAKYTLESLCGDEFWGSLSNWHRRLAGRCMAYMVEHERVPYRFAGHLCESPKKYMLK